MDYFASILGCSIGDFPFSYLGILIGFKRRQCSFWDPVIDKFKKKLAGWKGRCLSFGDRLVLVNAVLSSLPLHYMAMYKAPKKVINKLEGLRRNFLWGGDCVRRKLCLVNWATEKILFYHPSVNVNDGGWLIQMDLPLQQYDASEYALLMAELSNVVLTEEKEDSMFWTPAVDGSYSVSEVVRLLVNEFNESIPEWASLMWYNPIPSKVLIFHWLAIQNCIPVKHTLLQRGVIREDQNVTCFWCYSSVETAIHLLLHCPWASLIWPDIFRWWNLRWVMPSSFATFTHALSSGMGIKAGKLWQLIGPATIWFIWLARNNALFNDEFTCWTTLVKKVKIKLFE
ncbi:uncharacterized protein [Rutidosis leptorrhynchoides]|uniref:uncharacterized protein n=1 Tax=Rutidosis leptorrhynchoides TaxID=125765 RepID=UPI003A998608